MRQRLKYSARVGANKAYKERLAAANPKFHAGPTPMELEERLKQIQPTNQQEVARLLEMVNKMYGTATDGEKKALDFWKMQLATGTMTDQVKYEFLRRFYFWLLGRGTEEDTAKTMWGRGNAAVVNPEVRAYIEQFAEKRLNYALQLSLLSQRVPETINGYYLYFKYIVNGNLKIAKDAKGAQYFDMSHENFLEDFDMMQQVFDTNGDPTFADIIKPAAQRPSNKQPWGGVGATQSDPYPADYRDREENQLDVEEMHDQATKNIANRFGVNPQGLSGGGGAGGSGRPFGGGPNQSDT